MIEFHTALIAKRVVERCISFAKEIHAKRLSGSLVHKQVLSAIQADAVAHARYTDSEPVYERVCAELESEGVEIR